MTGFPAVVLENHLKKINHFKGKRDLGCELNRLGYNKQGKVERMGDLFDNVRASSFTVLYG